MPRRSVSAPLDFAKVRTDLGVPDAFPPEVEAAAAAAATTAWTHGDDATDIAFVTIDPAGSRDLDQAMHLEPGTGGAWRVHYAIADVAAFVTAGDAVDVEARHRGQTLYSPDLRTPLHPTVLGEGAASLFPDQDRPSFLWTIDIDAQGVTTAVDLRRATVRSRAQFDYVGVQAQIDAGQPHPSIAGFGAVGAALLANARERDAIDLGLPEQDVVAGPDGHWTVELRSPLPCETWNAQVSLLTGRAAADLMLKAGVGILRTLPPADPNQVAYLRRASKGLGVHWADGQSPGDVVAALDASDPKQAAFIDLAAELLRGAAYTAFDGTPPAQPFHAGVGAAYAHVTAPIRRLCDRFGLEASLAAATGAPLPAWVRDALPTLPAEMAVTDHQAKALDRAMVDLTEAFLLQDRVGETMAAAVVESGPKYGTVVIDEPAVRARCDGAHLPLGDRIQVRLTQADTDTRTVRFERVT
ncbi:MAG TPA: RNB domain-containing ribonuclease [Acidimicrobiales bacterium]